MARSDRKTTERNNHAIELAAARLFRLKGIEAVSIPEVMTEVGMTHGGFYRHFNSKADLAVAACNDAVRRARHLRALWVDKGASSPKPLEQLAERYLSADHRDRVGEGCPISALATDVAREPVESALRAEYVQGMKELAADIQALLPGDDAKRHSDALAIMAAMVGAVILSRASAGNSLSDEMLDAVKHLISTKLASSGE
ncbi:TetR/AcrR family transcriptional regulator [Noviherbaspirillum galbum]|uniref:TetR/AcrR family transcriptional regulator n=1 Tax=Noviherbaspirillum galbum TaxID=2709383 RepID=A0A6B3SMQ8_9BURK|nr:TetR/AcrR family transcriptional regulator [Noviherbaspirillum galbum]NEX59996.1 TetR/AcrR family transcriptional regulator [Noviherbaspirillum galbum]